jgi:hypothetical protein
MSSLDKGDKWEVGVLALLDIVYISVLIILLTVGYQLLVTYKFCR